jgi:hypothetical protein
VLRIFGWSNPALEDEMALSAVARFIANFFAGSKAGGPPRKEPIAYGLLTPAPGRHPQ